MKMSLRLRIISLLLMISSYSLIEALWTKDDSNDSPEEDKIEDVIEVYLKHSKDEPKPPVVVSNIKGATVETLFKASPTLPGDNEWQMEIRNASPYPIYFDVENAGHLLFKEEKIPAALNNAGKPSKKEADKRVIRFNRLNLEKPTIISFYGTKKAKNPIVKYLIAPGKKIFGTWENNSFRPQKGIFGKSQSGLSLNNNFTSSDIKQIKLLK